MDLLVASRSASSCSLLANLFVLIFSASSNCDSLAACKEAPAFPRVALLMVLCLFNFTSQQSLKAVRT